MEIQNLTSVGQTNALVMANAVEVGAQVVARIAGNEVSNTLQGETATKERLSLLMVGQLTRHLEHRSN